MTTGNRNNARLPLESIVVLDLSRVLSGPYCAMMLGDMGAKVWKVEAPGGDDSRGLAPPYIRGESSYFLSVNRSKRGICLDLTRPEGRSVLLRLAEQADVLLENFRPDLKDRMGIGYKEISGRNPRIVYCSISAFGQDGPYRDLPGLDNIFQGMSGLMQIMGGENDPPLKVGERIADIIAGMKAAFGIMVALYNRAETGMGQYLDLALLDCLIAAQAPMISYYLATGNQPPRCGNGSPFSAPTEMFRTADRPLNVCIFIDKHWVKLCEVLGIREALDDPRFRGNPSRVQHADAANELVERVLRTKPASHWIEVFRRAGIPCGPVYTYAEVFEDPQILHNGMLQEVDHPRIGPYRTLGIPVRLHGTPGRILRHAPMLGEHSREILREAGYAEAEIESLLEAGAVSEPPSAAAK